MKAKEKILLVLGFVVAPMAGALHGSLYDQTLLQAMVGLAVGSFFTFMIFIAFFLEEIFRL